MLCGAATFGTTCGEDDVAEGRDAQDGPDSGGRGVKPRAVATGENGSQIATAMTRTVVMVTCQLARPWMNGSLFLRMTWMMRVCVMSDSTNQPV